VDDVPEKGASVDIKGYMQQVPAFDRFLTVDELTTDFARLAETYPDIARLERVGSSQLGEPIPMLTIGNGSRNVLLFACPHPNEPIGAMLTHHLARVLCEDEALRTQGDYTWNLIACVDPDGTRLNEGWFAGPFTVETYARHFYRPAAQHQVEWTFPNAYKTNWFDRSLPETQMLMRVIDRLQPVLMGSLHNAGFGGVYYYISRDEPALYPTFHEMPGWEGLPLQLGEPEVPWVTEYAPAIFPMIETSEHYDYMERNGVDVSDMSMGGSSNEYASRYGTLTLIIEMAYFDDPRVQDTSETTRTRREVILDGLEISRESTETLKTHYSAVAKELRTNSSFQSAVEFFIEAGSRGNEAEQNWASSDPATERPATVAEIFSNDQEKRFYRLLSLGMLVRMLEGEVAVGNGTPKIRQHLGEAKATFDRWVRELERDTDVRMIPIRKLVAVQLGAILAAAQHLAV
jgi:hypothetical protein